MTCPEDRRRLLLGLVRRVGQPGVVDQHVDPAEAVERGRATRARQASSSLTSHGTGTTPGTVGGEGLEAVQAAGGGHHLGAGGAEHPDESVADPATGAGDDGHPAVEVPQRAQVDVGHSAAW